MLQKYRSKEDTLKNLGNINLQYYLSSISRKKSYPSDGKYLMGLNHRFQFIWFMVPKVATRSIRSYLKVHASETVYYHGFNQYPIHLYNTYYKFAFVRNPYDRLVSCWINKVVNKNHFNFNTTDYPKMRSFANFVRHVKGLDLSKCDRHLQPQSSLIDLNHVNFIGRLENINADYETLCRKLNLPAERLETRNISPNRENYRNYYTDNMIEEVFELYEKDILLFNYTF